MPGLGKSQGPRNHDYRLEKMAADLEAVVARVDRPVVLVGHSIGGMISLTFCRLFPSIWGARSSASC
jgi:pimeloyl-ACP methyl ester carboxylesterase